MKKCGVEIIMKNKTIEANGTEIRVIGDIVNEEAYISLTDIAVVKDGAGVGRTTLHPAKSSVIGTMQYLLPKENVLPEYLYYVVRYMHLEKYFTGATIPHIYFKDYKNEEFNLDTIDRQTEIVHILKKVENIMEFHRQELEKLDELIKARFIEMFGDPIINPMGWSVSELSTYIQFLTSGSRGWAKYFANTGEYFITIKNVKNCRITLEDVQHVVPPNNAEAKRTRVQEGDLLISITADLGRTGVVSKEIADYGGYINQHLTCIRLDQSAVRPLYVAYYMESDAGKRQFQAKNQSAVKAGLNFNSINSLRIMLPPVELQDAFIRFVAHVDKSKVVVQNFLLNRLYQAIIESIVLKMKGKKDGRFCKYGH